jgi:hypothetical protein
MATQTITQTDWAGGKGYVNMVYDDVTLDVIEFRYANGSTRGSADILVYNKQGKLLEPTPNTGYTLRLPPGSPEQVFSAPNNLDLDPVTGALNGWRIDSRGPAS